MIPYAKHSINNEDISSVIEVLQSDFITQGPLIAKFENEISTRFHAKYSVAVNSATSALHISCIALGLQKGDILWTSANSFVASANCGLYCNATVDFVDIDPETYNISIKALEKKLEAASISKQLPKILIPVHFAGRSCEMEKIYELSKRYKFKIIEDASHALGAKYHESLVGSCKYSDISVFSLHPAKIITSGEGGLALTNDDILASNLLALRTHGIKAIEDSSHYPKNEIWNYEQVDLGFNYRMTDISAALGSSQLKRLDKFLRRRFQIAEKYNKRLENLPLNLPGFDRANLSSWHLYVVTIDQNYIRKSQREVYEELHSLGIGVNIHYIPIHLQPFYRSKGFNYGDFPLAEKFYRSALTLPIYYGLDDNQQEAIIDSLNKVFLQ